MAGWVKIHRKLKDHWLWQDAEKLKWWLDILMEVNHESRKVLLKGTLVECKRGQCVKSLDTWAKEWRTTKKTVRSFFLLLQKDSMIVLESVTVSTRVTICNYESYQDKGNGLETQSKRRVNAAETQPTPKQECKELEEGEEGGSQSAPINPFYSHEKNKELAELDTGFTSAYYQWGLIGDKLSRWLAAFNRKLDHDGKTHKTKDDYRAYFGNWLKFQKYTTTEPEDYSPAGPPLKEVTKHEKPSPIKVADPKAISAKYD